MTNSHSAPSPAAGLTARSATTIINEPHWRPGDLTGLSLTVIGAAKSGLAAARTLAHAGARVLLSDSQAREKIADRLAEAHLPATVEIETGGHSERVLHSDAIVLSPGVPRTIPMLARAAQAGIPIIAEIEAAYRMSQGRRLVVTGSNGKTTTTTLLAEMVRTRYPKTFLGGNIGIPMLDFAAATDRDSVQVLEVSSFQLESIGHFTPDIGLITNFYPNHLDRYPSYDAYCEAKHRLAMNMDQRHWLVLNGDQPRMVDLARQVRCRVAWFGFAPRPNQRWISVADDQVVRVHEDGHREPLLPIAAIRVPGRHNLENVMAATAVALLADVHPEQLQAVVAAFPGVEHRLEWVRERNGVTFINDSKGTNCAASIIALRAMDHPVILIAGGRDKGTELDEWVDTVRQRARHVVLIGEAKSRFQPALAPHVPLTEVTTFAEAVTAAAGLAKPGEAVLLSPACASYDMFTDFEARGRRFKELVHALP